MSERLNIQAFMEGSGRSPLLDVRSPAEYNHAHIPGAINLPLFSDEERKVVGTLYKQKSREDAIKAGLDFFGPKMRRMVEEVEGLLKNSKTVSGNSHFTAQDPIFIYCWRGGMRSGAVAWLLELFGFKVSLLAGGYKSFRRLVLSTFEQPQEFHIIGGYTGSGKTELLQLLNTRGELVVDLEGIASHKGSAFGNINMPDQPTQEMFENLLATRLIEIYNSQTQWGKSGAIWIEDESQRIGTINLPNAFWDHMRRSKVFFLEIPFEERLKHLVSEYGDLDKEKLIAAIQRISKRLGGLETKNAISLLEENNMEECFRILLKYYDKHYLKGLHNREHAESLINTISCEHVSASNADLLIQKPIPA